MRGGLSPRTSSRATCMWGCAWGSRLTWTSRCESGGGSGSDRCGGAEWVGGLECAWGGQLGRTKAGLDGGDLEWVLVAWPPAPQDPWTFFEGLQLDDAEALHTDIKEYAVGRRVCLHGEVGRGGVLASRSTRWVGVLRGVRGHETLRG